MRERSLCRPTYFVHNIVWDKYVTYIASNLEPSAAFANNIETAYDHLADCIRDAVVSAGGVAKTSNNFSRGPPAMWWNRDYENEIRRKKEAYFHFCRNPSLKNFNNFIHTVKDTKRELNRVTADSFRSFCSSMIP